MSSMIHITDKQLPKIYIMVQSICHRIGIEMPELYLVLNREPNAYHWYRCSELSADRVAVICCGSADPVIETMMRLAGGTTHIDSEINKELFIAQAAEYQESVDNNKINKGLEFLLTKNDTHPLLAVRAYEAQKFAMSEEFKRI